MEVDGKVIKDAFSKGKKKSYFTEKISKLINDLIAAELNASQLYKAMGVWAEYAGYEGLAAAMNKHSGEERLHMDKLYTYALDRQCHPITPMVKEQPKMFKDLKDVLEKALAHEEFVEETYRKAVKVALGENDHTTYTFLQWYLNEQVEEIKYFSGWLDRLEIVGCDNKGMYSIDVEIGKSIVKMSYQKQ